jgi:hypothetical protein
VAVTQNTNNYVINDGAIQITGSDNSAGIVANSGLTGAITNNGTITIDENYTPTDSDNDGDLDGPFAQGSNRFGIHVLGAHSGAIINAGKILVEGNNSGGIALEGPLTGSLSNSADITVLGNNSVGIKAGAVSGDVILSKGTIQVQGAGSVGVNLTGDIGGKLVLQGTVQTTGYRYTTAPTDVSKLDADDLLQGGSAVIVGGMGSLSGAAIGALIVGLAEQIGLFYAPTYSIFITFVIMAGVLAVRPQGIRGRPA